MPFLGFVLPLWQGWSLKHDLLVLEALEDEVTLFVFKLPDLVIGPHIVVVQTLAQVVPGEVFRVEHVGAKVQHCPLVNLLVFVVHYRLLGVLGYELFDKSGELAFLFCDRLEALLVEVAQADQNVHQC